MEVVGPSEVVAGLEVFCDPGEWLCAVDKVAVVGIDIWSIGLLAYDVGRWAVSKGFVGLGVGG